MLRPGRARPAGRRGRGPPANLVRKELAWLRRGPPARTSKPRFRIEAAEALIADEPPPRDARRAVRFATRRLGRTVLELEDVTVAARRPDAADGVTWRLGPGDRIGMVGVNGSGKTTLLRLLAGELAAGRRAWSHRHDRAAGVAVAGGARAARATLRVLEAVEQVAGGRARRSRS